MQRSFFVKRIVLIFFCSEQLFCQVNYFNFQSNQDIFFVRFLAWHIKFEKRKSRKKR